MSAATKGGPGPEVKYTVESMEKTQQDMRLMLMQLYLMSSQQQVLSEVAESARAHSYILSKEVQKTSQFWLLTFWL